MIEAIIYPPTIDWHWMKQRPQQLLSSLAKLGYDIFYCNVTQTDQAVEQIAPGVYLVHQHEQWLKQELPLLRKKYKRVGVWCSFPAVAAQIPFYQADWVIYDCIDDFADWLKHEPAMVEISDLIVYPRREFIDVCLKLFRKGYNNRSKCIRY